VPVILDTDHPSILQWREQPACDRLLARLDQLPPDDVATTIVSFHEQVLGCQTYLSRARSAADVVRGYGMPDRVLDAFAAAQVLPFDAAAAAVFDGRLAQRMRLATMDLRIAAIALFRGLILLTRNVRDFGRVPGLVTEDWTV